ncbi:hypothetical protein IWX49DRAFT_601248 [Phyllosticta citricarpa]|uniref:Zn(2)-C6 fungal-type domain-containing protein n=2 Tax=Phyllosticta TaxID=121621 RepID=A0ABR1M0J6_9PEZI
MESGRSTHNKQPKAPKFRMSCDSCQASKIRCGQERPACRRCVKYNINCIYSPSRRAGRPRPRKTTPSSSSSAAENQAQTQTQTQTQTQPTSQPAQTALPTPNTASPQRDYSGEDSTRLHVPFDPSIVSEGSGPLRPDSTTISDMSPFPDEPSQHHLRQHQDAAFHSMLSFGTPGAGTAATDAFSAMTFADFTPPGGLHDSALTFDFMLSPVQSCGGPQTPSATDDLHAGRCNESTTSSSASTSSASSCAQSTDESGGRPMRDVSSSMGGECPCSATLLQHLAESTAARSSSRGGSDGDDCSAFLVTAVQKSKVLLDQCFRVAMDEVSMALGMGTVWIDQQAAAGGGTAGGDDQRMSLSTSLTRDKVPLRCGGYVVRAADRRHALRALIMKRVTEMQSAMGKLQQLFVLPAVVSSATCQSTCAGMVSELKDKISSKADLFKVLL